MINLKDANGDRATDTFMEQVDEYTIKGYRFSSGWTPSQQIYFTAVFSVPVKLILYNHDTEVTGSKFKSDGVKGKVCLPENVTTVNVKDGISPVSSENALKNIQAELNHWNFNKVVAVS